MIITVDIVSEGKHRKQPLELKSSRFPSLLFVAAHPPFRLSEIPLSEVGKPVLRVLIASFDKLPEGIEPIREVHGGLAPMMIGVWSPQSFKEQSPATKMEAAAFRARFREEFPEAFPLRLLE